MSFTFVYIPQNDAIPLQEIVKSANGGLENDELQVFAKKHLKTEFDGHARYIRGVVVTGAYHGSTSMMSTMFLMYFYSVCVLNTWNMFNVICIFWNEYFSKEQTWIVI